MTGQIKEAAYNLATATFDYHLARMRHLNEPTAANIRAANAAYDDMVWAQEHLNYLCSDLAAKRLDELV